MIQLAKGHPWILFCTTQFESTVTHFRDVMGMAISAQGVPTIDTQFSRYAQFALPGDLVIEVVEPIESLKSLYHGTIYSFTVVDVVAAREAMEARQVEFITQTFDDKNGWGWAYYRTPDGTIFQIQGSLCSV